MIVLTVVKLLPATLFCLPYWELHGGLLVERKEWKTGEFVKGANRFPNGYYWNVVTGGQPMVQVSLDPRFGTRIEDPRSPDAPILLIPTDWDGLVRLAVQIAYMAQAVGVRLPDGVLVKVSQ